MEFWFDYTFTQDKNADIRMKQGKKKRKANEYFPILSLHMQTWYVPMKHKKTRISVLWICLLTLVFSTSAPARDVIVSSVTGSAEEEGPNSDILHAIADRLKVRLVLLQAPFKRRLLMIASGEIDIMVGLVKHPDREAYIHFVEPAYKSRSDAVFFVPRNKADLITRYEDLYGLSIGTTIGARYSPRFDTDEKIRKEPVPKGELNLNKLLLGRIDAVVFPEGAGIDLGYKMGISDQIEIAVFRFSRIKNIYIGISKNSNILKETPHYERLIRQMIISGEIRQVYKAYYRKRGLPVPAV